MKYIKEEDVDKLFNWHGTLGECRVYGGPKGAEYIKEGKTFIPVFSPYLESEEAQLRPDSYIIGSKSDIIKNIIKDL